MKMLQLMNWVAKGYGSVLLHIDIKQKYILQFILSFSQLSCSINLPPSCNRSKSQAILHTLFIRPEILTYQFERSLYPRTSILHDDVIMCSFWSAPRIKILLRISYILTRYRSHGHQHLWMAAKERATFELPKFGQSPVFRVLTYSLWLFLLLP